MDRFIVCLVLASTIVSGLVVPREYASAQTKSDLVGTWSLVSVTVEQGGQKRDVQGPSPKGLLMLDSAGHFAVLTFRAANRSLLPTIAWRQPLKKAKPYCRGLLPTTALTPWPTTYWCFTSNAAHSRIGTELSRGRPFTLKGDELTYTTPGSTGAGATQIIWRRAG